MHNNNKGVYIGLIDSDDTKQKRSRGEARGGEGSAGNTNLFIQQIRARYVSFCVLIGHIFTCTLPDYLPHLGPQRTHMELTWS